MTTFRVHALSTAVLLAQVALTAQSPAPRAAPVSPGRDRPSTGMSHDDAIELTNGWALMAEGRTDGARERAERILAREPRNTAALGLAIEAELVGAGARGALARYERWLGQRTLEEAGILRRIARAMLVEHGAQRSDNGARIVALRALVEDGDVRAAEQVRELKGQGDPSVRAALGDEAAVRGLVAQLGTGGPGRVPLIESLASSGSPLAVPALTTSLQDPRPEIRAAAAHGLGRLDAEEAVPALVTLLEDSNGRVRVSAAGALLRLGDTRGIPLLQSMMVDPEPATRLLAAEAMASHPDGTWISQVRELATADNPEVRAAAARLLGSHDPEFARAVLDELARSDNPALRELATLNMGEVVATDLTTLRGQMASASPIASAKACAQVLTLTR